MVHFCFILLLLAVLPVVQTNNLCNGFDSDHCSSHDSYSYLYLKFENALIKDSKHLDNLRTIFLSSSAVIPVNLYVKMSAVNVSKTYGSP